MLISFVAIVSGVDCTSSEAQNCAHCSVYSPCPTSADPHCFSIDALDCLPCKDFVSCSSCALGWDPNCYLGSRYHGEECDSDRAEHQNENGETVEVSYHVTSECKTHPVWEFHGKYTGIDCGKAALEICNEDCEECEFEMDIFFDECTAFFDESDDEQKSQKWYGSTCRLDHDMSCPDGVACGPSPCVPGLDDMCIDVNVYRPGNCDEDEFTNGNVGEHKTSIIADGECRMDSSGRSYYKVDQYTDDATGNETLVGVLGCVDDACSEDCLEGELELNTCGQPGWSNGLIIYADRPLLRSCQDCSAPSRKRSFRRGLNFMATTLPCC